MAVRAVKPGGGKLEDWNAIVEHYDRHDYNGRSLVFGDSRAASPTAANWETIGLHPARMAVWGLKAEEILWTIRQTDPALTNNVKHVFLSAGGNNLSDLSADPREIAEAVQACIREIHQLVPAAQVYFIEMFEAGEAGMSARATEFNQAMDAAQERLDFHYVELPPLDPSDGRIYQDDGIHLTSRGARTVLMPAIQEARDLGDRYVDHFGPGGRLPEPDGGGLLTGLGLGAAAMQGGDRFELSALPMNEETVALSDLPPLVLDGGGSDFQAFEADPLPLALWDPTEAFLA